MVNEENQWPSNSDSPKMNSRFPTEESAFPKEQDNPSSGRSGDNYDQGTDSHRKVWTRFAIPLCTILIVLYLVMNYSPLGSEKSKLPELPGAVEVVTPHVTESQVPTAEEVVTPPTAESQVPTVPIKGKKAANNASSTAITDVQRTTAAESDSPDNTEDPQNPVTVQQKAQDRADVVPSSQKSSMDLLEEDLHANVVEQAKEAGVSTEGSTTDILERINHANVEEQARRAGVSTEGSTTEILERINHANVEEQARRAGVSTEGSTTEILERINHAKVVEQAKRAGVSTEGSTTEILQRINHAKVVEQAKRAGVSTEGSTTEILQRINQKRLGKIL